MNPGYETRAEILVRQQRWDVGHGAAWNFEQRERHIAEEMLQSWSPIVRPDGAERLDDSCCSERALILLDSGERVKGPCERCVGHVQVDEILLAMFRDEAKNTIGQVTVRIEQGEPFTSECVLPEERREKRRLTHACLSDRVEVIASVGPANAKRYSRVTERCAAEIRDARVVESHSLSFLHRRSTV